MKNYLIRFGQSNPTNYAGLSPTFIFFQSIFGNSYVVTAPGVSEIGASVGLYSFGWTATTFPVAFKIDGGATLSTTDRYATGILDPIQAVDEKVGTINDSVGASGFPAPTTIFGFAKNIGTPVDSFGTTMTDPTTIYGYVKRDLERQEGTATYASLTGLWVVLTRALVGGASLTPTALFSHLLSNNSGSVIKL